MRDPENGRLFAFLGCYQIDTKLRADDRGHYITVRYDGDDEGVKRNGNAMKKFSVAVSKHSFEVPTVGNQIEDGTFITDSDIGF